MSEKITVVPGYYYFTRDGQKVYLEDYPETTDPDFPYRYQMEGNYRTVKTNGSYYRDDSQSFRDLVRRWEEPVKKVIPIDEMKWTDWQRAYANYERQSRGY